MILTPWLNILLLPQIMNTKFRNEHLDTNLYIAIIFSEIHIIDIQISLNTIKYSITSVSKIGFNCQNILRNNGSIKNTHIYVYMCIFVAVFIILKIIMQIPCNLFLH